MAHCTVSQTLGRIALAPFFGPPLLRVKCPPSAPYRCFCQKWPPLYKGGGGVGGVPTTPSLFNGLQWSCLSGCRCGLWCLGALRHLRVLSRILSSALRPTSGVILHQKLPSEYHGRLVARWYSMSARMRSRTLTAWCDAEGAVRGQLTRWLLSL